MQCLEGASFDNKILLILLYTMTGSFVQCDPGIQVVVGEVGPEVDGRGLIQGSQPDRNALPEDLEAHFQTSFQPDEPAIFNPTTLDQEQPYSRPETASPRSFRVWLKLTKSLTMLGQRARKVSRSKITCIVISALLITCVTRAGVFGKRSEIHNYA